MLFGPGHAYFIALLSSAGGRRSGSVERSSPNMCWKRKQPILARFSTRRFIAEHTDGFQRFAEELQRTDWETIEKQSGLTRDQLREAADVYIEGRARHRLLGDGVDAASLCRGDYSANRQSAHAPRQSRPSRARAFVRCAAIPTCRAIAPWGSPNGPARHFSTALRRVFGFDPPVHHGHDVVAAINAMADGSAKVFVGMGGNFAAATPDSPH